MTTSEFDRTLETYGELAVRVGLNLQPGQRLLIIGPLANGGASLEAAPLVRHDRRRAPTARARRSSRRSGATRRCSCPLRARAARFVRRVLGLAAGGARRARRGGTRGAVDLRQRSRSAEGRSPPSWSARCSRPPLAQRPAVPRAHLAQPDQLGRHRGAGAAMGGASVFPDCRADEQVAASVGRHRPAVPARSARSDRRRGRRTSRRSPRARDYLNREAVRGAELHGTGHRPDDRAAGRARLGQRTLDEPVRHPVRAEPADRRSVHDAAQGSRGRHACDRPSRSATAAR